MPAAVPEIQRPSSAPIHMHRQDTRLEHSSEADAVLLNGYKKDEFSQYRQEGLKRRS